MTDYILSGFLGGILAFIFSVPAIILEIKTRGYVKDVPLVISVKTIFGKQLKQMEVFWVGLLLHIVVGFLFGFFYIVFIKSKIGNIVGLSYGIASLLAYSLFSWFAVNLILYPLIGMGVFAKKEGSHVWMDTLVTHLLLGVALWLLIKHYQPFFFN
jgi:hypothetical protein